GSTRIHYVPLYINIIDVYVIENPWRLRRSGSLLRNIIHKGKMSENRKFQLGTIGALSLSVVSSVSIVICNKALISTLGFTFALWMKLFEHKPFDARAVMGFGILNGISIGLLNLSLGFNSVGFYQLIGLWNLSVVSAIYPVQNDKTGNYPLHCSFGDPFLQKEIQ
ncbi:hypothetical protein Golob_012243, partial [Gossypium lobatum]|nr:hypothetical protein [Gossypium lobatum]